MTVTLPDVAARKKGAEQSVEQRVAAELVRQGRERGLLLTGPDGLLRQLTRTVIEAALNEEIAEHLVAASTVARSSVADLSHRSRSQYH